MFVGTRRALAADTSVVRDHCVLLKPWEHVDGIRRESWQIGNGTETAFLVAGPRNTHVRIDGFSQERERGNGNFRLRSPPQCWVISFTTLKGHRQFTGQVAENFESRVCDDYIKKKERTIAHSTCKSVAVFGSGGGSFSAQQNHEEGSWPRDDNAETILPL